MNEHSFFLAINHFDLLVKKKTKKINREKLNSMNWLKKNNIEKG